MAIAQQYIQHAGVLRPDLQETALANRVNSLMTTLGGNAY